MLWQVYVFPKPGQPDLDARRVLAEIEELQIGRVQKVCSARGYLLEGSLAPADIDRIACQLLADPVIESYAIADAAGELDARAAAQVTPPPAATASILLKPGVMDPVAQSVEQAIRRLQLRIDQVRTFRRYWLHGDWTDQELETTAGRVLANDAIEQVVWGPIRLDHLAHGSSYKLEVIRVPIRTMTDSELERVSRQGQLSLNLAEMQTIQRHFREQGRDPTDAELETLAQTWSEHCSHKTLRGRIDYEEIDERGEGIGHEHFENMLKETIFRATQEIRQTWGPEADWCVSVFEDNAGVVRFDEQHNVCFKVETHNHPSAIEPYGGANTGVGGVIRDPMGTGLGAKPIANTDVFCFAPPDYPMAKLPPGVLHPKRVMKGVVAGVRDYGNRMGIPTVNGAIYFDTRYLGNPLVFCGNVGLIPRDRSRKQPQAGDFIVAVGGRTGRDGIHGATFSSAELTHDSEELSGGAVQIGNAITEKMMLDVILQARDRGLYHAITDCGAGGFSSAVGEMAADIGARVWLEKAPLKYQGLSYSEIWISEAQERMVLAVPELNWPEFERLCAGEGVEATVIGRFEPTGRLTLTYDGQVVGDLDMQFLHEGRPPLVRKALYRHGTREHPSHVRTPSPPSTDRSLGEVLCEILASWNVCSKEWVIRQYDHEVQGASVVKPLVGAANDGPSDAAVIRPVLGSFRGLAMACGMNPRYGDIDPYAMAAAAIDEAIRNCVAVGADPRRIAILDNFCWGNTDRPEELGRLVRAALACRDLAIAYGTPFISGKDSLNNEFSFQKPTADRGPGDRSSTERIVIPPTLLISALGQIDDVRQCVTMDLKQPGNPLCLVGFTRDELGGSHYAMVQGLVGGQVPRVDGEWGIRIFALVHEAIRRGWVRACHDLSEGGLAAAAAEMAFAGGWGMELALDQVLCQPADRAPVPPADKTVPHLGPEIRLFSESTTRFLLEVDERCRSDFETLMKVPAASEEARIRFPACWVGRVAREPVLRVTWQGEALMRLPIAELKECWQKPLRW